jgi:hypothetical protein
MVAIAIAEVAYLIGQVGRTHGRKARRTDGLAAAAVRLMALGAGLDAALRITLGGEFLRRGCANGMDGQAGEKHQAGEFAGKVHSLGVLLEKFFGHPG